MPQASKPEPNKQQTRDGRQPTKKKMAPIATNSDPSAEDDILYPDKYMVVNN